MPAKDIEITGAFSINSYNLTYLLDEAVYKSVSLEYGSEIESEPAPEKEGFTFSGWNGEPETMPANDVTVTGSFGQNTYSLIYKVDGETYKGFYVEYGSELTAEPAPTKEGYTFSGWSEIPETMPANDVEITGTFSINSYNLVYCLDGEEYKTCTLEYGSPISPEPIPTKEGYTFSGWSEIPETMPATDVEITGTFSINSYTLTYVLDGEVYRSVSLEYSSEIESEPAPEKEGFTFSGWSEIPETMPANDLEITGTFSINYYLLTVIVDNQVVYSEIIAYGTSLTDYAEMLITKYDIDLTPWEWYSEIETVTMPAQDVTINAVYNAVHPVLMDNGESIIYDLSGKRIETDDISTLPTGIYIRNGRKYTVR